MKDCSKCNAFRPLDAGTGECRRPVLKAGENYRKVRKDDPGCRDGFRRGEWNRG